MVKFGKIEGGRALALADLAKRAGLSKMTASRALRGAIEGKAETRERVQKAAEQLG